jgi:hypothetical protein
VSASVDVDVIDRFDIMEHMATEMLAPESPTTAFIGEIMAEYTCSRADAASCCTENSSHADTWWRGSLAAITAGATPPQWWINLVQGRGAYTRWEQFLKHHPDVFDRLVAASLSVYHPKQEGRYLRRQRNQCRIGRPRS